MDTSRQLYEREATGWRRGLYDDVQHTFRAPIVNWIFRTLTANEPAFTRYLWGQVKPLFESAAFGRYTVDYRDAVLAAIEERHDLPSYRRETVGLSPAEFREARAQLATFDVVIPRLAVLFETVDRLLHGDDVGTSPAADRAATAPMPAWLDRDRGSSPTMTSFEGAGRPDVVDDVQSFHGFDEGLPSIYRCLLQWPDLFGTMWDDLAPVFRSDAFDAARAAADEAVAAYVESVPYSPRLAPDDLRTVGVDSETVAALQDLFADFNRGPVETVLPAVPVLAATLDVDGRREAF
ncbi:MAG: halocarboxylic acid dehydrogenase DehI family protein [Halobacterium sp.]